MPRPKVTIRKWNGDDKYSWAVFVNGAVLQPLTGLNQAQARYYRDQVIENLEKKASSG